MKLIYLSLTLGLFILLTELVFTQVKNPTIYPYGGVPDSSRYDPLGQMFGQGIPLSFYKAEFGGLTFNNRVDFINCWFKCDANFDSSFFKSVVNSWSTKFDTLASFKKAQFDDAVWLINTCFHGPAIFIDTHFNSETIFSAAHFKSSANFVRVNFKGHADFGMVVFNGETDFSDVKFDSLANFQAAIFDTLAYFAKAHFKGPANFYAAEFDTIVFSGAIVEDKLTVGSRRQKFDFGRTLFGSQAKLELRELVEISMQPEKIKHIFLSDTLSYFLKKDIIENLKQRNFKHDRKAQFELDYIFAKSTMYQEQSDKYVKNKWYQIWKWPKWFVSFIYYYTMGFGYRPFYYFFWAFLITSAYAWVFVVNMPERINQYVTSGSKRNKNSVRKKVSTETSEVELIETIINAMYLSIILFFTPWWQMREILTFFDAREKQILVSERLVGFLGYIALFKFSESDAILLALKSFFVG